MTSLHYYSNVKAPKTSDVTPQKSPVVVPQKSSDVAVECSSSSAVARPIAGSNSSALMADECASPVAWIAVSGIFIPLSLVCTALNIVLGIVVLFKKQVHIVKAMNEYELESPNSEKGTHNMCGTNA